MICCKWLDVGFAFVRMLFLVSKPYYCDAVALIVLLITALDGQQDFTSINQNDPMDCAIGL